jgi:hypothetical protein
MEIRKLECDFCGQQITEGSGVISLAPGVITLTQRSVDGREKFFRASDLCSVCVARCRAFMSSVFKNPPDWPIELPVDPVPADGADSSREAETKK